jgi:cell division protein FtsW
VSSRGRSTTARPDYVVVLTVIVLIVTGMVMVYSASFAIALREYGDVTYFIQRQAAGALLGAVAMVVMTRLDYRRLARWSPLILLGALVGLVLVFVPGLGVTAGGAQSWLQLGPLPQFQPSEFAKLAMVIYIAAWLAAKGDQVQKFELGVVPFVLMVGLIGGLLMLQPDFGTFVALVVPVSIMFFVAGASLRHVLALAGAAVAGGALLAGLAFYRVQRIQTFLNPESDPMGAGFQTIQMLIALGSGGLRGVGLGESRQKFFYVPAAHTDGIFSIIGEELGFIGTVTVLLLFALLIGRGFRIAFRARDDFGYLLAVGITSWIAFQAIINIAGITRSLPLTGIPLPFLSYGNSGLIALLAAVGVLLSVSRYATDGGWLERRSTPSTPLPRPVRGPRVRSLS